MAAHGLTSQERLNIERRSYRSRPGPPTWECDEDNPCMGGDCKNICEVIEYAIEAETDRDALLSHIEQLDSDLEEVQKDRDEFEKERDSLDEEIVRLTDENKELNTEAQTLTAKVAELEAPRVISDCVACKLGMRA